MGETVKSLEILLERVTQDVENIARQMLTLERSTTSLTSTVERLKDLIDAIDVLQKRLASVVWGGEHPTEAVISRLAVLETVINRLQNQAPPPIAAVAPVENDTKHWGVIAALVSVISALVTGLIEFLRHLIR